TAFFPWVAVVALLLIVARFTLPVVGLAGVEGENIKLLAKLLPVSIALLIGSIAIIVLDLRQQSRYVNVGSERLADEAEEWDDQYRFEDLSPERALGWQNLTESLANSIENGAGAQSRQESPALIFSPREGETIKVIDTIGDAEPFVSGMPPPFGNEILPEIEKRIEEIFGKRSEEQFDPGSTYAEMEQENEDVVVAYLEPLEPFKPLKPLELAGAEDDPVVADYFIDGNDTGYRRVTAVIMPDTNTSYDTTYDFAQEAESEDEQHERTNKKISDEVIARYQQLIESANLPVMTLFQLPPIPPEFAGRTIELDDLLVAHATRNVRVLGLKGLGGVGKTTLALKLADRLKGDYLDAQFYIDLRGASSQPLSIAEAQTHVIRAFLPTVRMPENEAELGQLYRSLLSDKRAIVLLDNAASDQQIAPLIAPNGCLTFITSRQHFSLPNSFLRHLEGLPESEARELLLKMLPQMGPYAAKIAELVGYLPLALKLAAGVLLINPVLKIEDYIEKLESLQRDSRGAGHFVRPADAVLKLSYEQLVPGLQKLWRMLAVFNDTFDLNAVACGWRLQTSP